LCDCLVPRRLFLKKKWCAYDEFTWSIVVGRDGKWADGKSALELRDAWQFLVDFLQESRFLASCAISLSFTIFCYLFLLNWLILIFFCQSGREFMLLFLVYMTYALCKVHGNSNNKLLTWLAGTRYVSYSYIKVQTIKLHCCNKYFTLYDCELLFTCAFVYSIHLIEIAIGIVIDWSSLQPKKLLIQKQLYDLLIISLLLFYTKQLIAFYYSPCNTEWHIRNIRTVNLPCYLLIIFRAFCMSSNIYKCIIICQWRSSQLFITK
jgi:hypothetical protein